MRLVDALIAFPFVILILVLVVLIGPDRKFGPVPAGLPATLIAFCSWAGPTTRGSRGRRRSRCASATYCRRRDPRLLGRRRIVRHLVPGVARVTAAYAVGDAILAVVVIASLAFLGAGVQPPTAEWGNIMYEGRAYIESAWWVTVAPGVVLATTGVALSLVADALLAGDRTAGERAARGRPPRGRTRRLRGPDRRLASRRRRSCLGLVGETGSGKSLTCRARRLLPRIPGAWSAGQRFRRIDLRALTRQVAGASGSRIALVPQASMSGLDPVMRIGRQLRRPFAP